MRSLKKLLLILPIIFLSAIFSSCGEVEGIDINLDIPVVVDLDEEFVTQVTITNKLTESQELVSIDVGDGYLEGIALIKTYPNYTDQIHIPLDNTVSYSFGQDIGPHESITIDLHWRALSTGEFSDDIDFCINSELSFISRGARTKVGG